MHTPTTAETTLPEATEGQASVTWKSLLAGALLSALLNYLAVRSYASVSRYSGFADHFNTVGVIFLLFWLALFCWVVRRVGKTLLFTSAEFAVVYAMLMVATVIPTMWDTAGTCFLSSQVSTTTRRQKTAGMSFFYLICRAGRLLKTATPFVTSTRDSHTASPSRGMRGSFRWDGGRFSPLVSSWSVCR